MGRIALILIVVLVIVGGAYFLITSGQILNPLSKNTATSSLGGQIYQQTQHPVSRLPQTNPFGKINPFKGVYKNPFQ